MATELWLPVHLWASFIAPSNNNWCEVIAQFWHVLCCIDIMNAY